MGLSATQNAATKDLGAMFSAGHAAADKGQGASSGTDTFGNLLSDRLQLDRAAQQAADRRADAQATTDDAGRKDAAYANAPRNDPDASPADASAPAQAAATPATSAQDAVNAKPAKTTDTKDLDAAAQAVADPAAQLAAQIEAARQAAQQAAQQVIAPTASQSGAQPNDNVTGATQPGGKSAAADAAALAALNAAATAAQGSTDPAAAPVQAGQAALQAASHGKDAKGTAAGAMTAPNTPTPPATPLPDGAALAQTLARTRAVADNTPSAVRQLGTASQAPGAGGEHGLPRRADASAHGNVTQTAAAAVSDAASQSRDGGNAGTQADSQGTGTQFQGMLARANGDASMAAPTFAVGNAGAAGPAAGASISPAQIHTLPTFGDAAWPQSMASQLAFMQVHRQSSAELQLNPAELGGLHVKLEVDNGAVNASFVCQHQAVAELVQDAMPRLRDAMQQGGMQLAQTSVSTGDFSQQQNAWQGSSAQGNGSGNGGGGRFGGAGQNRAEGDAVAATSSRVSSHDGAVDTFA
ncbi:MAG: flagellar hook-length control protein FliK [Burkholderiaceae bacterium]|nr:flagellar hook-length control protein FliK [Burkholderiaceae bacterium]